MKDDSLMTRGYSRAVRVLSTAQSAHPAEQQLRMYQRQRWFLV